MLEKKIESLSSSLEKFTNGAKMLDDMLAPRRAPHDKSGIGYHDTSTFTSGKKLRNVPINHQYISSRHSHARNHHHSHAHFSSHIQNDSLYANYKKPSTHYFQRSSSYFKNACIHCSLHSHDSPNCPNRYRIDSHRYKWIIKTRASNAHGPKLFQGTTPNCVFCRYA